MNIGIGVLIFFVSLIALVAEIILYFIFGIGVSFTGDLKTLSGIAYFFVGLMLMTGATGLLFPICAIMATLTKRKKAWTNTLIILLGLIFIAYFFIMPNFAKQEKVSKSLAKSSNVAKQTETADVAKENEKTVTGEKSKIDIEKGYISKYLVLKNIRIGEGYGQFDVPGYSKSKKGIFGTVKNIGDKNIGLLEIIVYFLDSNGQRVGEKSIMVISTQSIFEKTIPLKPNYSKDFGYILEEDAPSEWAGKIEVEISKIAFEEPKE